MQLGVDNIKLITIQQSVTTVIFVQSHVCIHLTRAVSAGTRFAATRLPHIKCYDCCHLQHVSSL